MRVHGQTPPFIHPEVAANLGLTGTKVTKQQLDQLYTPYGDHKDVQRQRLLQLFEKTGATELPVLTPDARAKLEGDFKAKPELAEQMLTSLGYEAVGLRGDLESKWGFPAEVLAAADFVAKNFDVGKLAALWQKNPESPVQTFLDGAIASKLADPKPDPAMLDALGKAIEGGAFRPSFFLPHLPHDKNPQLRPLIPALEKRLEADEQIRATRKSAYDAPTSGSEWLLSAIGGARANARLIEWAKHDLPLAKGYPSEFGASLVLLASASKTHRKEVISLFEGMLDELRGLESAWRNKSDGGDSQRAYQTWGEAKHKVAQAIETLGSIGEMTFKESGKPDAELMQLLGKMFKAVDDGSGSFSGAIGYARGGEKDLVEAELQKRLKHATYHSAFDVRKVLASLEVSFGKACLKQETLDLLQDFGDRAVKGWRDYAQMRGLGTNTMAGSGITHEEITNALRSELADWKVAADKSSVASYFTSKRPSGS